MSDTDYTLTDAEFDAVVAAAEKLGEDAGRNAADWWAQYAVGGRNTQPAAAIAEAARKLLADWGDDAWGEAPNLSGEWADGMTPNKLYDDLDLDPDSLDEGERDVICQAWEDGARTAYQEAVEKYLLDASKVD